MGCEVVSSLSLGEAKQCLDHHLDFLSKLPVTYLFLWPLGLPLSQHFPT